MPRTDLCPLLSGVTRNPTFTYFDKVFCNHGFPIEVDMLHCGDLLWSKYKEPHIPRCAFWNKCKRENKWDD
jgi:hypothetical protein